MNARLIVVACLLAAVAGGRDGRAEPAVGTTGGSIYLTLTSGVTNSTNAALLSPNGVSGTTIQCTSFDCRGLAGSGGAASQRSSSAGAWEIVIDKPIDTISQTLAQKEFAGSTVDGTFQIDAGASGTSAHITITMTDAEIVSIRSVVPSGGASSMYEEVTFRCDKVQMQTGGATQTGPQPATQNGKFGTEYSIEGSDTLLGITVTGASYDATRFVVGDANGGVSNAVYLSPTQKLMTVNETVQNLGTAPYRLYWQSLDVAATDSSSIAHDSNNVIRRADNGNVFDIQLQPGQSFNLQSAVVLPASGTAATLTIGQPGQQTVGYDLTQNKVTPIAGNVADSSDASGDSVAQMVTGTANTYYPLNELDIKFISSVTSASPPDGSQANPGKKYFVITLEAKNQSLADYPLLHNSVFARAVTSAGDNIDTSDPIDMTTGAPLGATLAAGQERTFRMFMEIDQSATVTQCQIHQAESRVYAFSIGN